MNTPVSIFKTFVAIKIAKVVCIPMKKMRILRDLTILVLGVGAIFGVVTLFNSFELGQQSNSPDNLSAERQRADSLMNSNDWVAAIPDNLKLVERDPFDGHAWFRLAQGRFQIAVDSRENLRLISEELGAESDVAIAARTEMESLADDAIECYEKCADFARYRRGSFANIAYLHGLCGRNKLAIEYFDMAVRDGYFGRRNSIRLGVVGHRFASLAHLPGFWPSRVQEVRNYHGDFLPVDTNASYYVPAE